MSTAEKVRAAADHIERVGLHKGAMYALSAKGDRDWADKLWKQEAPCCTVGALALFGLNEDEFRGPFAKFIGALDPEDVWEPDYPGDPGFIDSIPQWNDAEERTQDEVVAALRAFADKLDTDALTD